MLVRGMITYGQNNLPVIKCAANMAHHGLLGPVREMRLCEVDLTSVPAEQLTSLTSSVTDGVQIENVSGFSLVNFMDNVKSKQLEISSQSLGSEETHALVRAMESRVEKVRLHGEVKLDIGVLIFEYSGRGKCGEIEGFSFTENYSRNYRYGYIDKLKQWAQIRNWKVTTSSFQDYFAIKRM